jgi:hypothetical protein
MSRAVGPNVTGGEKKFGFGARDGRGQDWLALGQEAPAAKTAGATSTSIYLVEWGWVEALRQAQPQQ